MLARAPTRDDGTTSATEWAAPATDPVASSNRPAGQSTSDTRAQI